MHRSSLPDDGVENRMGVRSRAIATKIDAVAVEEEVVAWRRCGVEQRLDNGAEEMHGNSVTVVHWITTLSGPRAQTLDL